MTEFGHDDDRTVMMQPKPAEAPAAKKRSPWLWVGLLGCAGLLCLGLVGGVVAFFALGGNEKVALPAATATQKATQAATPTQVAKKTVEPTNTATEPAPEPSATPTEEPTETPESATPTSAPPVSENPTVGAIIFATGVSGSKPISAATIFPADVTEIHALFDYQGFVDGDAWERRWYQNGDNVGGGSGTWDGGESGTYDLSLSNSDKPLGGGDWKLEIYVRGKLAGTGTFVIKQAAAAAAPTATSAPAPRPASGGTFKIAFARWDGGKHNLYVADTTGGGEKFVLERAAGPSWSADSRYLYVYGEEGVDKQVREGQTYTWQGAGITNGILRLDLSSQNKGIPNAMQDPSWKEGTGRVAALAPNGAMLAYDAIHGSSGRRIFFLGTAANQQYRIEIPGEQPEWSPDSAQIVYRSGRDNKQGIWISNRDDSGAHNITNEGDDSFPRWSPDGKKIAFHRSSGGNVDIYVMNVDGSNIRRLTDAAGPDTLPAWTPDGRIVFRSARAGSWGIYIMNADGSDQKQIIANADPGPDWTFGRMDVR
jgi:septal ring-binding cell division protein DamX